MSGDSGFGGETSLGFGQASQEGYEGVSGSAGNIKGTGGVAGRSYQKRVLEPSEMEKAIASYLGAIGPDVMKYVTQGLTQSPGVLPKDLADARNRSAKTGQKDLRPYLNAYSSAMKPSSNIFETAMKLFGAK